ncbi:tetratricopeptide repeat protein [Azospirillum argentinense]|uniref:Tetratricopeptide repeat protein n=1 Tax=Azospirillum argentinense TaxID=2970906 RepID=A0A4D8P4H4_9PROT|nr:tetratricopeptide repeat protein [Azospirillum argentinense]QCN93833.1 tetratricopeptide repeat protein [Azospirillum argentinense]
MGGGAEASGDGSVAVEGDIRQSNVYANSIIHNHPPAAAPAYSPRHQLPSDLPDFTGRETEVKNLIDALDRNDGGAAAVSAIRGMGGIGKTTLAVHAARRLLHRYPDAQILVNLQGHSEAPSLTPVEAMAHVVRAFHPELKAEDDPQRMEAIYRSVLAGQRALIILDNAADTAQVESLVPPPPCGLIVTARESIPLHGAVPLKLGLLPRGESVALLRSAARPARATEEEWDRIAALCDDLPLALRVAGSFLAHAEDCSAADYIADLTDARNRLDHLTVSGTRGDVGTVLAHSARRLAEGDPALAALWQCLSVFPADFDRPAAAAVWEINEEKDAVESLRALLERALLLYDGDTKRYRLHDLMRPLARNVFEGVFNKDPTPGSSQRIEQKRNNFILYYMDSLDIANRKILEGRRQALTSINFYLEENTNISNVRIFIEENRNIYNISQNSDKKLILEMLLLKFNLSYLNRCMIIYTIAHIADSYEYWRSKGEHLLYNWSVLTELGSRKNSVDYYEDALIVARKIGDRRIEGLSLSNLGKSYAAMDEMQQAVDYHRQALTIAREAEDRHAEGINLISLSNIYFSMNENQSVIETISQLLDIARETGDRAMEGSILSTLGLVYARLKNMHQAISHHEQALFIARERKNYHEEYILLGTLGVSYKILGNIKKAIRRLEQALALPEATDSPQSNHYKTILKTLKKNAPRI